MAARAGGDTLQGRQAYGVLSWVFENPQARSAEGRTRVSEMGRSATGAALREIQDVATMLARLAGTLQFTGIADQALDLAYHPDQKRGPDGKWIKGGGSGLITTQMRTNATQADVHEIAEAHARAVVAEATREMKAEQKIVVDEMVAKVQEANREIAAAHAKIDTAKDEAEADAHHKHIVKLAVDGLMAVATGIIAFISVKIGAPESLAVTLPVVPLIMQTIIEFLKKLLWRSSARKTGPRPST